MKRSFKWKCIAALTAFASLFILGGCSLGTSLEDVKEANNLKAQVTYYANGGLFESHSGTKEMYYPAGNPAAPIGLIDIPNVEIERDGYELEGWYKVVLDNNGNPVYENTETQEYKLGDKVDFATRLQEGDHWVIAAKWTPLTKVRVKLVVFNEDGTQNTTATLAAGESSYKTGDEVRTFRYTDGKANFEPFTTTSDYTFVEYYSDAACTKLVQWPVGENDGVNTEADTDIYVKYVAGDWNVVRKSTDISTMFNGLQNESGRYYLANDITYTSSVAITPLYNGLAAKLYGNGYTISGLKVTARALETRDIAVFGEIKATAVLRDITFENLTVTYEMKYTSAVTTLGAYFAFTGIQAGASVKNVTLDGSMTVKFGSATNNKVQSDFDTHWKYGGYESDEAYETAFANSQNKFTVTAESTKSTGNL